MGGFARAAALVVETDNVAAAGCRVAPYTVMRLRALQGRQAATTDLITTAFERATACGQGIAAAWAQWSIAILNNGVGYCEEACGAARQVAAQTVHPRPASPKLPSLVP